MDYTQHNEEQAAVWAAYHAGKPTRVPVNISVTDCFALQESSLNPKRNTFEEYFTDPAIMFEMQLESQYWASMNLPGDRQRGLPEEWVIFPYFQNVTDAAWLGAELYFYDDGGTPATRRLLDEDNKRMLFDRGIPDPFSGILGIGRDFNDYYKERAEKDAFHDRPIRVSEFFQGFSTDGPFTVACNLRGATDFCLDLYEDPDYAQELLAFIVESTLRRRKAWCEFYDLPLSRGGLWLPDDSIAMLSCEAYIELVLPHHKRLAYTYREPDDKLNVHLCGDSSRHFRTMMEELEVGLFDTGFPIDHGRLRRELGLDVTIQGQLQGGLLLHGTAEEVAAETRRILRSGIMDGGKFTLNYGLLGGAGWLKLFSHNPSRTPMDNLQVMYETVKQEGMY